MISKNLRAAVSFVLVGFACLLVAMSPPPEMEFKLLYEISPAPEFASGTLLQCQEPDCSDGKQSGEAIYCYTEAKCRVWLVDDDAVYFQIEVFFSDDTVRTSNIFEKTYAYSEYEITVLEDELVVVEVGSADPGSPVNGLIYVITLIGIGIYHYCPAIIGVLAVVAALIIVMIVRRRRSVSDPEMEAKK